jgi:hypothetical protein
MSNFFTLNKLKDFGDASTMLLLFLFCSVRDRLVRVTVAWRALICGRRRWPPTVEIAGNMRDKQPCTRNTESTTRLSVPSGTNNLPLRPSLRNYRDLTIASISAERGLA